MENILEEINKVGTKFLLPLSLKEICKIIVDEAVALANADGGKILIRENGSFKEIYKHFLTPVDAESRNHGFAYKAFKTGKSLVVDERNLVKPHPELVKAGVKSVLFIPLSYKNQRFGVLIIRSYINRHFTNRELDILKLFGSMANLAIHKTKLYYETQKALETRDSFISAASHELKTPLTSIKGYVQLLQRKFYKKKTPEANWIKQLSRESLRLNNLINEFLELNKIRTGKTDFLFKEFSMKRLITHSITEFKSIFPHRVIIFREKIENGFDRIICDPDKLAQALVNLLSSVARFTPIRELIVISVKTKPTMFVLEIGSSVNDTKLKGKKKIRRESLDGNFYFAQYIVKKHHGSINVLPKPVKETLLKIKLPKANI